MREEREEKDYKSFYIFFSIPPPPPRLIHKFLIAIIIKRPNEMGILITKLSLNIYEGW